jgi:hypothetical protein
MFSIGVAVGVALLLATWLAVESRAQAPEKGSLSGIWVRNSELSDAPAARGDRGAERGGGGSGRRGMGRGGGFGGGGFGGGGRGGRGGDGRMGNPEEMARMREAMRAIMEPGDHLTITQTDSMVVLTDQDGRTTRLSPDGRKVKDDNTHVERKSRWEGGNLISEISGAGSGKITQTLSVDPDAHQLRIAIITERDKQSRTVTHVYDSDAR